MLVAGHCAQPSMAHSIVYTCSTAASPLGTCRRRHCDKLLGPETAALHSVAAPRCERRPSSSLGRRLSSGDDGGGPDSFSRGSGGSGASFTSADEEAAGFWAAVYRAGVAMDAAHFLEGASERFAASVPEVSGKNGVARGQRDSVKRTT
jgi:hypothetical protein